LFIILASKEKIEMKNNFYKICIEKEYQQVLSLKMTTITQSQITRVRVSPNCEYDTQADRFFDQRLNLLQSIEEMLVEYLGVKIIKSVWVYYSNDPYAHAKCEPARSQYVFVDFEWLPNTDPMVQCSRAQLFHKHNLIKLQNQYTTVYIQDKSINVLSGSIRNNICSEDVEFMGLQDEEEEDLKVEDLEEEEEEKAEEHQKEETKTLIRVRVCPIYNDGLTQTQRYFNSYSAVLKMHQQYVEELLVAQFGVKIIKSIDVYYATDPYMHTNEHSQYVFVDFEWLPNTDQTVADLRHKLMAANVIMEFQERYKIRIEIQDKRRNVFTGSTSSILHYHSNGVPINSDFIDECLVNGKDPFTGDGDEEEPSLGYRDAYVNFIE
jgi:hypothetical protein